jgi:hypothetical protein
MRIPSLIDVDPLARELGPVMRPLYEHVLESIKRGYRQRGHAETDAVNAEDRSAR